MRVCLTCGETNPQQARFCASCGARFETTAPRRVGEARRTVTVLFADVVGSTALGERTDPETVRRVLTRVFDMSRVVIEQHGGVVEKFIGDAIMAVFGLPTAHEDDALRAVRAADGILTRLDALNREFERQWGVTIQLRTGVNTGEVATGDPDSDEIFATGDAVNVAARLEQSAPPMAIVIGQITRESTRGTVEVEPMEPLELKGKKELVPAFRVTAIPDSASRTVTAPLAGRHAEMVALQSALSTALDEKRCPVITVIGDVGVGKTRLVSEFVSTLAPETVVWRGRCPPYGEGGPYGTLAQAIRHFLDPGGGDNEAALARIGSLMAGADEEADVARALADITGIRESAVPEQQACWAVRRLVERITARTPLAVVVDDLQWAQQPVLELLLDLQLRARTPGMLILCTARPEIAETHPDWTTRGPLSLTLEPLSESACREVVAGLLGDDRVSEGLLRHVGEVTKGNPLFVEEIVSMLVRDDVIEHGEDGWAIRTGLSALPVPASIRSVLDARLDSLAADERDALERASVVGEVFYEAALQTLVPIERRERLPETLRRLEEKGLVEPSGSDLAGEAAFRFHQILLRDVAESRLRRSDSAYLHERFADWLGAYGTASADTTEIMGFHLEQAHLALCELGPVDERGAAMGRRGSLLLSQAASRAWARGQDAAAGALYERAARLLPDASVSQARSLLEAAKAYSAVDTVSMLRAATRARDISAAAGNEPLLLFAEAVLADFEGLARPVAGSLARTLAAAQRALAALAGTNDPGCECWAYLVASTSAENLGHSGMSIELAERAAEVAAGNGMIREYALATVFGVGHYVPGDRTVADVIRKAERALQENDGDRAAEAMVSGQMGVHLARAGRLAEACAASDRAIELADELGSAALRTMLLQGRAAIEMYAGKWEAAEACERQMAESVERGGLESCISNPMAELSTILFETGRPSEALEAVRAARACTEPDDILPETVAACTEALVTGADGHPGRALAGLDVAAARLAPLDMPELVGDVERTRGRVLVGAGRGDEARQAFEMALRVYERIGLVPPADRTRAMMAEARIAAQ